MSDPLVSVGIPFLNNEDCLLDAVRSIFAQTYSNWELILAGDDSTDRSRELAQSINDTRVRVLSQEANNKGLPAALNQITQAARGEYIARMDADDLCHPERLARQVAFLKTHENVDVVGTSMYILDQRGRPASKTIAPEKHEVIGRKKSKRVSIAHATIMGRAKWFRRWPYNENTIGCEDYELWVKSFSISTFSNISDPLYFCNEFISSSLSKYIRAQCSLTKVIWEYAPSEIGRFMAAYYVGRSYAKIAVYAAFGMLGLRDLLVRKRYLPLTREEYAEASAILDIIKKTELPVRNMKHGGACSL